MLQVHRLEDRVTPAAGTKPPILTAPTAISTTELISQFHSTKPLNDLANIVAFFNLGTQIDVARSRVEFGNIVSIALKPGANPTAVAATLDPISIIDWVTPNYIYSNGAGSAQAYLERIPNDPRYGEQWPWPRIDAATAWDTTTGSATTIVAVIDDGIDLGHPDLQSNILVNSGEIAGDGIDNDHNGFTDDVYGWDFANNSNNPNPDNPLMDVHGTQVAGLLAARFDNSAGVTGIAGTIKILPVKVVGSGPVTSLSLAKSAAYAVGRGATIISTSLNLEPLVGDPVFSAAVDFAYDRGVLWFNSAGNAGAQDPARLAFEQILFVAATDRDDHKTYYSNYGSGIDLSAPGGDPSDPILTTTTRAAGTYSYGYGTSFSAPIAAGTAALIWSAFPGLTRDQVASRLSATADDLNALNPNYHELLGSGRVNAGAAVTASSILTRLGTLSGLPGEGEFANSPVTDFTLHLPNPLARETVTPGSFELVGAGDDNTFGTSDDITTPLSINDGREYAIGTNDLHFRAEGDLSHGLFVFRARADRLWDPFGNSVDGDGDGSPGGDLVRHFGVATQVKGRVFVDIGGDGLDDPSDPGLSGVPVFIDTDHDGNLDSTTVTSLQLELIIPDNNPVGLTTTLNLSNVNRAATHVTVTVTLRHTFPSDLTISLTGPGGQQITLFRNRVVPVGPNGLFTLTFDDFAPSATTPNATGRMKPEQPLAEFIGTNANGTWTLNIKDTVARDEGVLVNWAVTVNDEPVVVTVPNGGFTFAGLEPTTGDFAAIVPGTEWQLTKAGYKPAIDIGASNRIPLAFAVVKHGALYGRVFQDNSDNTFSAEDKGLANTVVYVDSNHNGQRDTGEPFTITDSQGNYTFPNLGSGTFQLRVETSAAYPTLTPLAGFQTVTLTPTTQASFKADFLVTYDAAADRPDIRAIAPNPRSTAIDHIDVVLAKPVANLTLADFNFTRNGIDIPLDGATLIGSGITYTIVGLIGITAAEGNYRVTLNLPAVGPIGPTAGDKTTNEQWIVDTTGPKATFAINTPSQITFNETVTGLNASQFQLLRNGITVPVPGLIIAGSGSSFQIVNLNQYTQSPGQYTLTINGTGVTDLAGNSLTQPDQTTFTVTAQYRDRFAVGADAGGTPILSAYDPASGGLIWKIYAFEPTFTGGVRVATGDVNGDGVADVIVSGGPGRAPEVRIFNGISGTMLNSFNAFETSFTGGVYVATADFNGDGIVEIVVTPDQGGGPRARVLADAGQTVIADFFAIDDNAFRGGARASLGDVNHDGTPDLIVSAGFGGGPRIAGYDGASLRNNQVVKIFNDFFAFEQTLRNGAFLAVGDVNGDGYADLITAGGPGGGPRVQVLSGQDLVTNQSRVVLANFFAGNSSLRNGVRVGAKDIDGDGKFDILASGGPGAMVNTYFASNFLVNANPLSNRTFDALPTFSGGVYVG